MINQYGDENGKELPLSGMLYIPLAQCCYEANALEDTLVYAEKGYGCCSSLELNRLLHDDGTLILSRIWMANGNYENADSILARADARGIIKTLTRFGEKVRAQRILLNIRTEMFETVTPWIEEKKRVIEKGVSMGVELHPLELEAFILFLISTNSSEKARNLLNNAIRLAEKNDQVGNPIKYRILLSILQNQLSFKEEALSSLKVAVRLSEPESYIASFCEYFKYIRSLLFKLRRWSLILIDGLINEYNQQKRCLILVDANGKF